VNENENNAKAHEPQTPKLSISMANKPGQNGPNPTKLSR